MNKGQQKSNGSNILSWVSKLTPRMEATIGAMLERKVNVLIQDFRKLLSDDYGELFPEGPIAVSFPYGNDRNWHILIPATLAGGMADIASMGSGITPFDENVHGGTLAEIWGQVESELLPDIATLFNEEIDLSPAEVVSSPEMIIATCGADPAINGTIKIEGWGESQFVILFEKGFLMNFDAEPEETAAEPVAKAKPAAKGEPARPPASTREPVARPASFEDFEAHEPKIPDRTNKNIDSLLDITLPITIELGRTKMLIREVLDLGPGSVIELDRMSGEPVDLFVNDKKFARGEVVVIEENFGVRITELIKVEERLKALK